MATEKQQPMASAEGVVAATRSAGVATSARTSLKRARILFDTTSRQTANGTSSTTAAAAKRALVPPVDRSLHKASVARRVRSNYPVIPSDVNAAGDEEGGGAGTGAKSKGGSASLTAQVLGELRQETARRIVSGEAAGTDASAGASAGGGSGVAGQIVLHREVDLGIASGAAATAGGAAAAAGGGVLALPGQKVRDVGGAKDDGGDASGTVRPGGILVVSVDMHVFLVWLYRIYCILIPI